MRTAALLGRDQRRSRPRRHRARVGQDKAAIALARPRTLRLALRALQVHDFSHAAGSQMAHHYRPLLRMLSWTGMLQNPGASQRAAGAGCASSHPTTLCYLRSQHHGWATENFRSSRLGGCPRRLCGGRSRRRPIRADRGDLGDGTAGPWGSERYQNSLRPSHLTSHLTVIFDPFGSRVSPTDRSKLRQQSHLPDSRFVTCLQ